MTCPLCRHDEQRDRCCWPMPDSPLSFFGPETWLDDDAIDLEIMASRIGGGAFDSMGFADALGWDRSTVRTYLDRGLIPAPKRTEPCAGGNRSLWSAEQVAGVLLERGRTA